MNLLTDDLPRTVEIDGLLVPINTNFFIGVKFELLMHSDMSSKFKLAQALSLYYGTIPLNAEQALQQMLWFYRGGKEEKQRQGERNSSPAYSFAEDDARILAAFWSEYRINLNEVPYLHWWMFRALFDNLPDHHEIRQAMRYRVMKIPRKATKEQKTHILEMKKFYALQHGSTEKRISLALRDQRRQAYIDRRYREAGLA